MKNPEKISTIIVDDHAIFRDGMELMLKLNPNFNLIGSFPNASTLFEFLKKQQPDIYILDINLPKINGIEIAKQLKKENEKAKIVFLTSNTAKAFMDSALKTGAKVFLTKDSTKEELFTALDKAYNNQYYFGKNIEQSVYENYANQIKMFENELSLSEREIQVLRAFANGLSYKEVEEELNISKKTIETHKKHIFDKLGLKNQTDLIKYAIKNQIIEL